MENIEQQVSKTIAAAGSNGFTGDSGAVEAVAKECARVKIMLKKGFLSTKNERLISRYFSFHQRSLIGLIDQCTRARRAGTTEELIGLESHLIDLLGFLEQQFPCYFEPDLKPPDLLKDSIIDEINQTTETISAKFLDTSLEDVLLRIVLTPLVNLVNEWAAFSYRKLYFLRTFKARLLSINLTMDDKDLLRQDFCRELIRGNFNTEEFFEYYTRHISRTMP